MVPRLGAQLAGYRLDAVVGRGGGGVVYRATHVRLDRTVALKLLAAELASDDGFRRRFEREARLAASLEHPHIVPVYDAGEVDGLLYLAMRFIEGPDLASVIRTDGPFDVRRACAVLGQVADALDVAHAAGLVHRDVKPANILLGGTGEGHSHDHAYLTDFGLTRRLESTSLTGDLVAGTLAYMAPERFRAGAPPDAAVDVYALGCTAYTCLSGAPPFDGASVEEVLAAHLFAAPPSLRSTGAAVPAAVDAAVARATAKDPAHRYPTCTAFVDALRAAIAPLDATWPLPPPPSGTRPDDPAPASVTSPRRPRRRLAPAGVAGVVLLVAVALVVGVLVAVNRPDLLPGGAARATASPLAPDLDAVALDGAGNLYVATLEDDRVQKVTPTGTITTVAGGNGEGFSGDGGPATQARLNGPQGLAVDPAGNVYIADTANQRVRRIDPAGTITTVAGNGSQGSSGDGGLATLAQFRFPVDVALDRAGNVYVAEAEGARIRRIDRAGQIDTVAGTGTQDFSGDGGPATEAQFVVALSIAIDGTDNLYIADNADNRVRRVDPAGVISTVAGTGEDGDTGDGGPATAATVEPVAIAVDTAGTLHIASGSRVRKVDAAGVITAVAGTGEQGLAGDGGPAVQAQLASATAIAVGADGSIVVGDDHNHRVRRIDPAGIIDTVAGSGPYYPGDGGPATAAFLSFPTFPTTDRVGRLYISDTGNDRIRRVEPDGTITTVAGNGLRGFAGDGGPASEARLNNPLGVAVDAVGNVYVADYGNQRIRRVGTDGIITTIAGTGSREYSTDGVAAVEADLADAVDLAVTPDGAILFTEVATNRIRGIDGSGTLTTIAGTGEPGYSGDGGPATAAALDVPYSLDITPQGELVFTDANTRIRRIAADGTISTVAGADDLVVDGDPATAESVDLGDVLAHPDGSLYVADTGNRRVRRVDPAGVVTTAAGSGNSGSLPDGPATGYRLEQPIGLARTPAGDIYIADAGNDRLVLLDRAADTVSTVAGQRW